jgi:GT2 family glycosyltransferase
MDSGKSAGQPASSAPTVSILLLCWNHAEFLRKCVEQLAAQSDRDFQVIFLDNYSTDDSFEIATGLFEKYSIVATMLRNERPNGICANFNALLAHSSGELICPLSTDDWYLPRFVEAVRAAAIDNAAAAWYYGTLRRFTEEQGEVTETRDYADGDVWPHFLREDFRVNFNGCAYRRASVLAVGAWDEAVLLEDLDLTFRLAETAPCHRIDEPLAVYRCHLGGASKNLDFMVEGARGFFAKHSRHFPNGGRLATAEAIRQFAARAIDIGDLAQGATLLAKSFRTDPLNRMTMRTFAYLVRRTIN